MEIQRLFLCLLVALPFSGCAVLNQNKDLSTQREFIKIKKFIKA